MHFAIPLQEYLSLLGPSAANTQEEHEFALSAQLSNESLKFLRRRPLQVYARPARHGPGKLSATVKAANAVNAACEIGKNSDTVHDDCEARIKYIMS